MSIDLHIHTTASDGDLHPCQVLELAIASGLKTIAFADHETTKGYEMVKEKATTQGIQMVPAVELQAWFENKEIHVLGYFINTEDNRFQRGLAELRTERNKRAKDMVERIADYGFNITWEQVAALAYLGGPVTKGHIMQALRTNGYIKDRMDAVKIMDLYLNQHGKAYSSFKFPLDNAMDLIRGAGGIPVLAHPGLVRNDEIVLKIIESGISGLEVYYNYFGSEKACLIKKYEEMAHRNNLIMTGGSDYHGTITPVILGELDVPPEVTLTLTKIMEQ